MRAFVLSGIVVVVAGCHTQLRSGRCDRTSDCAPGFVCDLAPTPQGNGRCVAMVDAGGDGTDARAEDGGVEAGDGDGDGDGGGDGGADTVPECVRDVDCPEVRPACSSDGMCVDCSMGLPRACAGRNLLKAVCGAAGTCVECMADADCSRDSAKPVCDATTNTCARCSSDAQCAAKLGPNPGICMGHQDGRCAAAADTIYVQDQTGCVSVAGAGAGSAEMPYCNMQPAVFALASSRRLIVVRGTVQASNYVIQAAPGTSQITIVGQQGASIAGGAYSALVVDGVDLYARDAIFKLSAQPAIIARNASILRLNHVVVDNNPGGGVLVDGAGFVIRNTSITNNGPGDLMGFPWGGLRVQNVSVTGPALLENITVQNNKQVGISCSTGISGPGVLATGNAGGVDISSTCQITACTVAGPICGAQP